MNWPKTAECLKSGFSFLGVRQTYQSNLFKATNPPGAPSFPHLSAERVGDHKSHAVLIAAGAKASYTVQSSTTSPFTLSNSRVLAVTKMRFLQKTCPAISVSYSPMRRPCLSSSVRISPAACASCSV